MTIVEVANFVATACSLTVGTDLFMGRLPDNPDACGAVFEYQGKAGDYVLGSADPILEHPRVQIAFRGDPFDYETPRDLAETAYQAAAALAHQTLTSTRYLVMEPLQPPFLLKNDKNDRPVIAFNCQISKALSA